MHAKDLIIGSSLYVPEKSLGVYASDWIKYCSDNEYKESFIIDTDCALMITSIKIDQYKQKDIHEKAAENVASIQIQLMVAPPEMKHRLFSKGYLLLFETDVKVIKKC